MKLVVTITACLSASSNTSYPWQSWDIATPWWQTPCGEVEILYQEGSIQLGLPPLTKPIKQANKIHSEYKIQPENSL